MDEKEEAQKFLSSINNLHTTELGAVRIRRNLGIEIVDIIGWCKEQILSKDAQIERHGKNWYITTKN